MNKGTLINEIFWLRSIACVAVTFRHALKSGYYHFTDPALFQYVSYIFYNVVLFAVPAFVFLSEFLLANKYAKKVPPGFIKKRLKILAIPYVFMSIIYSFFEIEKWSIENILVEIGRNIFLGESTIYFILIIFQFYLLHMLLSKSLNKISPKIVLPTAFGLNFIYLSIFNFSESPNNPIASYLWDPGYWMPFIGWIFYFVLGYYCGKNYNAVKELLRKHSRWVLLMPIFTFTLMLVINKYFLIDQNSKRIDMLLFATCLIFFLTYVSSYMNRMPKIVMFLSNYSFSIFLLNEFFFLLLLPIKPPSYLNILTYSIVVFLLSMIGSIALSYLLNKFQFGKYLVGRVMTFQVPSSKKIKRTA